MAVQGKLVIFLLLSWIAFSHAQSGCGDPSTCICPYGYYYSDDNNIDINSECCTSSSCNDTSLTGGSGTDCMSCDASCDHCFGPDSNQCYSCYGPYIVLKRGEGEGGIICEDNLIRNTSLDIVQCVDNCTDGFIQDSETSECICGEGRFLNDTQCIECVSLCASCVNDTLLGCLRCTVARYEGVCVGECPSGTFRDNSNGICVEGEERFSFTNIIAVIAAVLCVSMVCFILIATLLCFFIWRSKTKRQVFETSDYHKPRSNAAVVMSESFKRVTMRGDNKVKSMNREISTTSSGNPVFVHNMRHSFDPYHAQHNNGNTAGDLPTINGPSITEEGDEYEEAGVLQQKRESFYVEMSPATSQEHLENPGALLVASTGSKQHRKVGPSHSFQSPGDRPQYPRPADTRKSLPPVVGSYSETYEEMAIFSNTHHQPSHEEEEHEMYEDLSPGPLVPVIPPRGVKPPPTYSKDPRRETLDNEYVQVVKQDRHLERSSQSTKNLLEEPEYINVSRSGDHRLRSVTSPNMGPVGQPPRAPSGGVDSQIIEDEDDQPEYENWNIRDFHPQEEVYY